jgi:hypothetical protein
MEYRIMTSDNRSQINLLGGNGIAKKYCDAAIVTTVALGERRGGPVSLVVTRTIFGFPAISRAYPIVLHISVQIWSRRPA